MKKTTRKRRKTTKTKPKTKTSSMNLMMRLSDGPGEIREIDVSYSSSSTTKQGVIS
jgi:hypothetical protein